MYNIIIILSIICALPDYSSLIGCKFIRGINIITELLLLILLLIIVNTVNHMIMITHIPLI